MLELVLYGIRELVRQFLGSNLDMWWTILVNSILLPGLTHPNARMTPCEKGTVVAIFAEGKTNPLAIGKTSMSTEDIRTKNKGIGVENYHYLNDGLWQIKHFK